MLADTIWWTRKSRIQAANRLLATDFHAQLILVWYSAFSVGLSVYLLKYSPSDDFASVTMVIYSIMVMSISIFIGGRNFRERGMLMKQCYEQLNVLYRDAKVAQDAGNSEALQSISMKYHDAVNSGENHREIDYVVAMLKGWLAGEKLDREPGWFFILRGCSYCLWRVVALAVFYVLPIGAALFILERSVHLPSL